MSENNLTLDSIIQLSADHLRANLDDEIVLLSLGTARYHAIRGAGNQIFQLLDQPRSVRELCDALTARFDIDDATCQRQVLEFIRVLIQAELAVAR